MSGTRRAGRGDDRARVKNAIPNHRIRCRLSPLLSDLLNEAHSLPVCSGGFMNAQSLNGGLPRAVCLAVGVAMLSTAGAAAAADTTPPSITAAVTPAPNAKWLAAHRRYRPVHVRGRRIRASPFVRRRWWYAPEGSHQVISGHGARQGRQHRLGQRHAEHRQDEAGGDRIANAEGERERMVVDAGHGHVRRHRCVVGRRAAAASPADGARRS